MGLVQSVMRYMHYNDNPSLILTNFETKNLNISPCLIERGFHLHLAIRCAHLSFLCYRTPEELSAYCKKYADRHAHYHIECTFHDPATDIDGMIMLDRRDHSLYIVFRGTCNRTDVMTDLEFVPTTYENMEGVKVHSGMYRSLLSVRDYLIGHVKQWQLHIAQTAKSSSGADGVTQQQDNDTAACKGPLAAKGKVYIMGHSLGGCLATLLAPMLFTQCGVYSHVYSIGACPVGNDAFMTLLNDCTYTQWNVVNHLDIVPVLTRPLQLGYSQFPHIAYYDGRGDLAYLSGSTFNDCMLQRIMHRLIGWKQGNQILDHLMYLGLTARTAMDTPLDEYEYCKDAHCTWLDTDQNTGTNENEEEEDDDEEEKRHLAAVISTEQQQQSAEVHAETEVEP